MGLCQWQVFYVSAFVLLIRFVEKACLVRCRCMRILSTKMARTEIDMFIVKGLVVECAR